MAARKQPASRDLARTQEDILRVATEHFTRAGFYGARVDEIAEDTSTTKRMIYYYFGSKDGLFAAALAQVYADIRSFEESLHLADLSPREAVAHYVSQTIRYHEEHPGLALLARTENVLGGVHIVPESAAGMRRSIVDILDDVLERGRATGDFQPGPTGLELHLAVTALANFRITNAATINALFGFLMRDADRLGHDIDQYIAMMLGWLSTPHLEQVPAGTDPTDDGSPGGVDPQK
jgi:AcrR family transcriptional regulator